MQENYIDDVSKMCIAQARAFAVQAHGDQKYGVNDYVKHLDDVYEIASKLKEPDLEIFNCLLFTRCIGRYRLFL